MRKLKPGPLTGDGERAARENRREPCHPQRVKRDAAHDIRGQAEILIDDKLVGVFDAYAPVLQWQQRSRFEAASAGRHTLAVKVLGRHGPSAQGSFVDIDGFVVE
jgi:hypothetical protein